MLVDCSVSSKAVTEAHCLVDEHHSSKTVRNNTFEVACENCIHYWLLVGAKIESFRKDTNGAAHSVSTSTGLCIFQNQISEEDRLQGSLHKYNGNNDKNGECDAISSVGEEYR